MEPELMTSGAFARRSRLSPKALRVYEEKGLLTPWTIDESNGYRYYASSQLEKARLIALLRRLEMPLDRIAVVIEMDPVVAVKEIGEYWKSIESDMRTKRKLVRYLDRYLLERGNTMFRVETRTTEDQKVATILEHHQVDTLSRFIDDGMRRLHEKLSAAGLETGIPFVVYHGEVNNDSNGPVEVCVPFTGSLEPTDDIIVRIERGGPEAYTRLTRSQVEFPGILEAYEAVDHWIGENNREMRGSPREVYFADWDAAGPDDPAADVAFPMT